MTDNHAPVGLASPHVLCHPDPRYFRALTCGASSPMASVAAVTCQ